MTMSIDELVSTVANDFGYPLPSIEGLKAFRSSWLDSALTDPSFEVTPNALRAVECLAKVRDLNRKPESCLNQYLDAQTSDIVCAEDVVLDDIAVAYSKLAGVADLDEIATHMRHGPGAVTDGLFSYDKWLTPLALGEIADCADPLLRLRRDFPRDTNRYCEVPKTSWVNRGICIESASSQLEQQGIGVSQRRHLRTLGFDLSNQWKQNIAYARRQSSVTIDLSSASDLVSVRLMRLICVTRTSKRWLCLMENARSQFTALPDQTLVKAETFASMGNGFCFTNLTLVCMAVVCAAIRMQNPHLRGLPFRRTLSLYRDTTSVFGDDIVTSEALAPHVCYVLSACGLRVNYGKTSFGGQLKETCGAYFINSGIETRLVYAIPRIKYITSDVKRPETLISLCSTQRALFSQGYTETAAYVGDYLRDRHPCEVTTVGWTPMTDTSENLLRHGTVDPFGASLVCFTDYQNTFLGGSLAAPRWSKSFQRSYIRCNAFRSLTRPVYLGDSVGYASALFGDAVKSVALEENLGNVLALRTSNVYL